MTIKRKLSQNTSVKCASTNPKTVGSRADVVRNLKTLKAPEEGGINKEYDEFLEKVQNHVTIGGILEKTLVIY